MCLGNPISKMTCLFSLFVVFSVFVLGLDGGLLALSVFRVGVSDYGGWCIVA